LAPGFPHFKGKNRFHSLEYRHGDGCKLRIDNRPVFYVQNVGEMKVKYHRPLPEGAKIKHVVLKKSMRKWYVCLQCEIPEPERQLNFNPAVGIDVGLKSLLALSDGTTVDNPRWLRSTLQHLRVAQRRLSRRKKGSHRRRKAAFQIAKIHEHIQNQRLDFWHKTTRILAESYSLIAIEDLTLDFMLKNKRLSLSAADAGLGMFRQMLDYKAEEAGSRVVAVNPKNTTQACSQCGVIVPKGLSVRIHKCPECGLVEDRDINAARNILNLAMARTEPSGANVS
jgi:putative transposase